MKNQTRKAVEDGQSEDTIAVWKKNLRGAIGSIRRFGAWGLGGLLIVLGVVTLFVAGSTLTGIIWLALGIFITPTGRGAATGVIGRDIPLLAVVIISVALFATGSAVLPPTTTAATPDNSGVAAITTTTPTMTESTTTESTTPTSEATAEPDPETVTDSELSAESYDPNTVMRVIGTELAASGVTVRQAEVDDLGPVLAYETTTTTEGEIGVEMGFVAVYFAEGVALSPDLLGLPVYVYRPDGTMIGSYEIDRDWAEAYNAGTISSEEYINQIVATWVYA